MGVPVIMQISHLFVFMKGILRMNDLQIKIDKDNVTFKCIINLNVNKSMSFFPENLYFLSISFIKTNI